MRICLVDDDSIQLDYLSTLIEKWSKITNTIVDLDIYHSAEEILFENSNSYPFDLMILDIQMNKINGIQLAKRIREVDKSVIIAFLSGIADYVFEGYEVQAIQYLLKPLDDDKLVLLLDLVKGIITKEPKHLIIKSSGEKKKINYNEIYYIESMGHYVTIHLENEKLIWKNNLKDVYIILGKNGFISVHRSYLVNLRHIEEISKEYCILSNKEEIPISRNSYKTVNTAFIDYYKVGGF